ncbi:hypothetical protein ACJQWK_06902 [Exserohilum turcicum]|uniref:Uncharacterized protein n=1 Tax=Exserohilum turcicum (strain 28A) TaxID=671987 RepID=R0K7I0_EXST2|nr:uncharacterized protein SETTUDRAFT_179910 [Exserohilum turcica Et28A]EOA85484.1 hypothetical protein SETTUDRAFT_179910 [Exserohilum turcica Et28A]
MATTTQATTASARATIEAFHARLAAAEKQQFVACAQRDQQQFQDMYSPCNASSTFHDLQCGHRIQTEYTASCGVLCARAVQGYPFVCPTCLTDVVRAEVALQGLTLRLNHDAAMDGSEPSQDGEVRRVAERYIAALLRKGYRACKAVSKFDEPRLQFFDGFMREDGFGGVRDEGHAEEEPVTPRKRPGMATAARKPARPHASAHNGASWSYREPATELPCVQKEKVRTSQETIANPVDGHPSQPPDTWVRLPAESAATEAVRKAMEAFTLL